MAHSEAVKRVDTIFERGRSARARSKAVAHNMVKYGTQLSLAILLFSVTMWRSATAENLGPISGKTPPATCNPGSFISGIRCTGSYCGNMTISCRVFRGAALGQSSWTASFSEEQGRRECPQNHLIAGLACQGSYCDNVSLYCVEATNMQAVNCSSTPEVSEEHGGQLSFFTDVAGQSVFARAMKCSGRYCDNKSFEVCEVTATR
jgi:hypothetical protein